MRGGISFRPFRVVDNQVLVSAEPLRDIEEVRLITIALVDPDEILGFGQPSTNVKISPTGGAKGHTYSICSDPSMRGAFQIGFKVYPGGRVSGHLAGLRAGQQVFASRTLTKPMINLPDCSSVGLIAFGIGITEMLHTARRAFTEGASRVTLLWANRYAEQVCFTKELKALIHDFPDGAFRVRHCLSRGLGIRTDHSARLDGEAWTLGRVNNTVIKEEFGTWPIDESFFMVVGSKSMMTEGWSMLHHEGFTQPLTGRPNPLQACWL